MNNAAILAIALLIASSATSIADGVVFHLPKHETREISRESVVRGTLKWSMNEGESIVVSVYSPGNQIGELKAAGVDLQEIYDAAKTNSGGGAFFNLVDEYVVGDEHGQWFLIQYEYRRPGVDRHLNRFRIGRLARIAEGADLFFLVDYMHDSHAKELTSKMDELGEHKLVKDRRR